jgi:hypothetical protein
MIRHLLTQRIVFEPLFSIYELYFTGCQLRFIPLPFSHGYIFGSWAPKRGEKELRVFLAIYHVFFHVA